MGFCGNCSICGKKLYSGNKTGMCYICYSDSLKQEKINHWLETGDMGIGVNTTVRGAIRDYILDNQGDKCAICGIEPIWNGEELHFILDHIDGDASNQSRENVRLICPNCDSQLPTYKSRNKNSARNARKDWLKENVYKEEESEN